MTISDIVFLHVFFNSETPQFKQVLHVHNRLSVNRCRLFRVGADDALLGNVV